MGNLNFIDLETVYSKMIEIRNCTDSKTFQEHTEKLMLNKDLEHNMFTKEERAGFKYTFAHWCAFQMTALNLKMWKFKYIFHDIEKPFLMLLWKDYAKVQMWHRTHNNHHLEYKGGEDNIDCEALIIDWECSHFTKEKSQLKCREEVLRKINSNHPQSDFLKNKIIPLMDKLNL